MYLSYIIKCVWVPSARGRLVIITRRSRSGPVFHFASRADRRREKFPNSAPRARSRPKTVVYGIDAPQRMRTVRYFIDIIYPHSPFSFRHRVSSQMTRARWLICTRLILKTISISKPRSSFYVKKKKEARVQLFTYFILWGFYTVVSVARYKKPFSPRREMINTKQTRQPRAFRSRCCRL